MFLKNKQHLIIKDKQIHVAKIKKYICKKNDFKLFVHIREARKRTRTV